MQLHEGSVSRDAYEAIQIDRSRAKFSYCKVSHEHVRTWKGIVERAGARADGAILCLGTRNGREIDLFRTVFRRGRGWNRLVALLEVQRDGWNTRLPILERFGRSDAQHPDRGAVLGVEINPDARRADTLIASFDALPREWDDRFEIVFSNAFDQSRDPHRTASEWRRVLAPGGFAILGFADAPPTATDPVGRLTLDDLRALFPGELVYYNRVGSNYRDVILRLA